MDALFAQSCNVRQVQPIRNPLPLPQQPRSRPVRAKAGISAAAALPQNLIGIHSGVFVGDWKPQDAERAIKGAKDAGYDLIECEHMPLISFNAFHSICFVAILDKHQTCLLESAKAHRLICIPCMPVMGPTQVLACIGCHLHAGCCDAVNLSVPEEVDANVTRELLQKYDLQAAGSLVRLLLPEQDLLICGYYQRRSLQTSAVPLQGLSKATDISSSDADIRRAGIQLLSGALKVRCTAHTPSLWCLLRGTCMHEAVLQLAMQAGRICRRPRWKAGLGISYTCTCRR